MEIKEGVYVTRTGKFKILQKSNRDKYDWEIDEGSIKKHPWFNIKLHVTKEMQGDWWASYILKNCEYLGEL